MQKRDQPGESGVLWLLVGAGSRAEPASALAPSVDAIVPYDARQALALDDDHERKGGDCCFVAKEQSWRTAWRARSLLTRTKRSS
jgi:hypothetical protein